MGRRTEPASMSSRSIPGGDHMVGPKLSPVWFHLSNIVVESAQGAIREFKRSSKIATLSIF